MPANVKIVIEKHPDTYVAHPIGLKGVVAGQRVTYEEALALFNPVVTSPVAEFRW